MSQRVDQSDERGSPGRDQALDGPWQGPEFAGPVEPLDGHAHANDHYALIYESRDEQFAAVVPYVQQGLERGERVVYIYDDNDRDELIAALREGGVDVDGALDTGQLSLHPVEETYLEHGECDVDHTRALLEAAVEEGVEEYEGFRVTAEETWLAGDEDAQREFMACEAHVNDILDGEDAMALCQYNREALAPTVIEDAINTHTRLVYDDTVCRNFYYTPPEEYFGPARLDRENERKLATLVDRTEARAALQARDQYHREFYEAIADPQKSFPEKVEVLLELGRELFDLEIGYFTRTRDDDTFEIVEAVGDHDVIRPGVTDSLCDTYCEKLLASPGRISVVDAADVGWTDDPAYERFGLDAYFGTTVHVGGEGYGTLCFASDTPREAPFTSAEQTFLDLMGQWAEYELEQQRRERYLRESYEITSDPALSFDEKLDRLLGLGQERFGCNTGFFSRIDGDTFEVIDAVGDHELLQPGATEDLETTYCQAIIEDGSTRATATAGDEEWVSDDAYETYGLDAYVGTPVSANGEAYGTLCFASEAPREQSFTDSDLTFLELMGQWVEYELEQQRRERYLRESYEITSDPDLAFEEKLERLLELGREWFGLEMGGLNHLPSWDGPFRLETGVGLGVDPDEELWSNPGAGCFCRQTITEDEPVTETDASDGDWADDPVYERFGLTSYIGTKVTSGSGPYGTLWFGSTEPREQPFSEGQRTFIDLIGQWVSYEIERRGHKQFQEELYEITADSDRSFDEKIEDLLDLGRERFDLDMGFFLEKEDDHFRVVKTCGTDLEEGEATLSAHPGHYCKQTISVERPVGVEDVADAGWDDDPLYRKYDLSCYLGAPAVDGDGVYGTICFSDDESQKQSFTEGEYAFLELLGQCVSYELERKQREADLEETIDRLRQSNDRLQQFAYAASHDLQEPLRMVSSYLQLLENRYADELDEEAREYIDFAVDGADRMRAMVEDLLAYSRVEQADGEFDAVDCEAVLDRAIDDLQVRIEKSGARIETDPLPTVVADGDQLEQLFGNLLSNAVKYNESERPRVQISVDERIDRWEFAVSDNGIGVDPEKADRIFEVFKRLHHGDEYTGTGIGLSLCQEIVDNHGGDIWVDSEPGEGSTFSFTIPKHDG